MGYCDFPKGRRNMEIGEKYHSISGPAVKIWPTAG